MRSFHNVAILKAGRFVALDGTQVEFAGQDLARLAENYDPVWQAATLNIDHANSGPALGRVEALRYDGEYLRADLAGVPVELAEQVDAGRYPFRSAEVYRDVDGRGPYLRALALLGAKSPAVRGLPTMPPSTDSAETHRESRWPLATGPMPRRTGTVISIKSEVAMSTQNNVEDASRADPVLLAEENLRLSEENRRLKQTEQRRSIALFLSGLRESGRLTPAIEHTGVEALLLSAEESGAVVQLADGSTQPMADVLRNLLGALPVAVELGERGLEPQESSPVLTDEELQIARQLGLSADELREIKAAG
jgi:hypothetical protein